MRDDDDNENESAHEKFEKRAKAVSCLFRRKPHNLIEEIEKLGFTYVVDKNEDAEEIAEERTARPTTADQAALVSFLEGTDVPDKDQLALWHDETRKDDTPFPLWRRYFRSGSAQLKKLLLFGLNQTPADRDLLNDFAFLHTFLPMPREILARYSSACDKENDPQCFKNLAEDFDDVAHSFSYDALMALREHYAGNAIKMAVIENLLAERAAVEKSISF